MLLNQTAKPFMGYDETSPPGQNGAVQLARKLGEHKAKTDRTHTTHFHTHRPFLMVTFKVHFSVTEMD